jgi:hypothetical protein
MSHCKNGSPFVILRKGLGFAFVALLAFGFAACDDGSIGEQSIRRPPPVYFDPVNQFFQFGGGEWKDRNGDLVPNAVPVLGSNNFRVSGGGVNIFYTGVSTKEPYGEVILPPNSGEPITHFAWCYLYSNSKKIGVTVIGKGPNNAWLHTVWLGKTTCAAYEVAFNLAFGVTSGIDFSDMQDDINGTAEKNL